MDPPSDFNKNNKTINCNSVVKSDEDDSRIWFDNVDTDAKVMKIGKETSKIRFNDGDTNSLKEVAELEKELNGYTVLN